MFIRGFFFFFVEIIAVVFVIVGSKKKVFFYLFFFIIITKVAFVKNFQVGKNSVGEIIRTIKQINRYQQLNRFSPNLEAIRTSIVPTADLESIEM